ncbi:hypothetical protein ARMGADRAFT_1018843 [Armillaria gallica]|uniref:Uncharacterized protein n=1 Tax=Armillaria gallica TaxID=47427 RepID=A0A2H3CPZ4_ARMGA|nr:hypothetical protein ARMGADRAFT_1018843 [Armillaria gallica]
MRRVDWDRDLLMGKGEYVCMQMTSDKVLTFHALRALELVLRLSPRPSRRHAHFVLAYGNPGIGCCSPDDDTSSYRRLRTKSSLPWVQTLLETRQIDI